MPSTSAWTLVSPNFAPQCLVLTKKKKKMKTKTIYFLSLKLGFLTALYSKISAKNKKNIKNQKNPSTIGF